jgi:hypothetical protein
VQFAHFRLENSFALHYTIYQRKNNSRKTIQKSLRFKSYLKNGTVFGIFEAPPFLGVSLGLKCQYLRKLRRAVCGYCTVCRLRYRIWKCLPIPRHGSHSGHMQPLKGKKRVKTHRLFECFCIRNKTFIFVLYY